MHTRSLTLPARSLLQLGARGTGKTIWLRSLHDSKTLSRCHAIHLGDTSQKDGPVTVHTLRGFLAELTAGRILPH